MTDHDAAYRQLFSDPRLVADLLTGFVREPWVSDLDFSTLERLSGSFVSEDFKRRETDVIWRVKFRDSWLYVYLVIEFQSTIDRYMALRMLVYVGMLYQHLLKEKQIEPGQPLPPVLPVVLYNGDNPWTAPEDMAGLIAPCSEELLRYQPRLRYFLLDEQRQEDSRLAGMENLTALVFRIEKCRTPEELEGVIRGIAEWAEVPEHGEALKQIQRWIEMLRWPQLATEEKPHLDLGALEGETMPLAERMRQWDEQLLQKGRQEGREEGEAIGLRKGEAIGLQKGREEGRQEGLQEGREEGEAEVLLRLLEKKFGPLDEATVERVRRAGSEKLLLWAERILSAESIEEIWVEKGN